MRGSVFLVKGPGARIRTVAVLHASGYNLGSLT